MESAATYFVNDVNWAEQNRAVKAKGLKDTNVFSLHFKDLPNYKKLLTLGDPITCATCKAILSNKSAILNSKDYKTKYQSEEESKDAKPVESKAISAPLQENESIWICEFCDTHTKLRIQAGEIPQTNDAYYLLKAAPPKEEPKKEEETKKAEDTPLDGESDVSVIFCLDVSGSMDTVVDGKSRLTWMKEAITTQINEMAKVQPKRKVGLVMFGEKVQVLGATPALRKTIAGQDLLNFEVIRKTGQLDADTLMARPVGDAKAELLAAMEHIVTEGDTALGPGVLAALGLAVQGKSGSQVVLCTDGLASCGLGRLDQGGQATEATAFYDKVGGLARECGVSISIITIKGAGARVDILGHLCQLSGGLITKVAGSELGNDFGLMMQDEVVGTQVEVEIHLHKGLRFRNEDEKFLTENGSLLKKSLGNVTRLFDMTFEYEMKNVDLLTKEKIDIEKLSVIPFQAQIQFTASNGDRCLRVITQMQQTTKEAKKAEEKVNVEMISKRGVLKAAEMGKKGNWAESEEMNMESYNYVQQLAAKNMVEEQKMRNIVQMNTKMSAASRGMQSAIPMDEMEECRATVEQYTNFKYI